MTREDFKNAKFIDIHAHRQLEQQDTVIIYSFAPGLNELPPRNTLFSAGIHPWNMNKIDISESFLQITSLSKNQELRFIGESGLDSSIEIPLSEQEDLFLKHFELSESTKLPLIIHCVRQLSRLLEIRNKRRPRSSWIIHDFNGNQQMIEQCLREGSNKIYFSLGPRFFKSPHSKIANSLKSLPLDRIFFETDDQEEINVKMIYEEFAKRNQIEISSLKDQIIKNYKGL